MRGPRISYPNAVFHIINRFVDRHPFFRQPEDFRYFLDVYFEVAETYDILTYAYALIPNHFHLAVETPSGEISLFLQRALTRVACEMNRRHQRTGHLFQGRSKTLLVQTESYFHTMVAYVLLNPVKAKLAADVFSYPWSSAGEMLKGRQTRIAVAQLSDRLGLSGEAQLREWLAGLDLQAVEKHFAAGHRGSFLGDKQFRDRVLRQQERRRTAGSGMRRRGDRANLPGTLPAMRAAATAVLDEAADGMAWRSRELAVRDISWYIAFNGCGWKWDKIRAAEKMEGIPLARLSMAIARMRRDKRKLALAERALARLRGANVALL